MSSNPSPSHARRDKAGSVNRRSSFQTVALLLQGGGSLGAYQGGVYQALAEADLQPDWIAGISIGAINAAIIAGNPPEKRVERLRAFWDRITANPLGGWADPWLIDGASWFGAKDAAHGMLDQFSAFQALVAGAPGFSSRVSRRPGCCRRVRPKRPVSTTPARLRRRSRAWWISTASTAGRCASASGP